MIEKYWDPIYNFYKKNVLYIIAFLSIIILLIAYTCFEKDFWAFDVLKSLGFTLISGGVFAVIVKSEQFSNIFQNELRNIIYGDEDLKKRVDLEELWDKVTKALCNQKFKLISKKLHDGVKICYLPINHEFYYRDHKVEIHIEIDKENPEYVIVNEQTETTLISEDTKEICYKFSSSIPLIEGEEELTTYEVSNFTVDKEKKVLSVDELVIVKKDNYLNAYCHYKVSGKKKYKIIRVEKKRYNLKANPYRQHNAIWLYQNFSLDLIYSKELKIDFIEMGVVNKFETNLKDHLGTHNRLNAHYEGLIFTKQGFILLLNKL
ncbi:hypothetical protein [Flavobacterium piscisymbiosum]|uniref:Uncharacterized protein n=1 Tax=Flavobacterium piscisymbiosum TaxID=2893753 RepID=A0ABS8MNS7_9FLAO|nr:hypothetical protein [Flavobacterium sp. F-30]MCC9066305.1 hypothetical protein [Flavobacterium sp. F-30]